jgi:hypothetical protein
MRRPPVEMCGDVGEVDRGHAGYMQGACRERGESARVRAIERGVRERKRAGVRGQV